MYHRHKLLDLTYKHTNFGTKKDGKHSYTLHMEYCLLSQQLQTRRRSETLWLWPTDFKYTDKFYAQEISPSKKLNNKTNILATESDTRLTQHLKTTQS
jgi:hypothetical protein